MLAPACVHLPACSCLLAPAKSNQKQSKATNACLHLVERGAGHEVVVVVVVRGAGHEVVVVAVVVVMVVVLIVVAARGAGHEVVVMAVVVMMVVVAEGAGHKLLTSC